MSSAVKVHKGRSNTLPVALGIDVSADTITSQIRSEPDQSAPLLATWLVSYVTDGTDGEITLYLDDTFSGQVNASKGYMDIKRVTGGEPVPVFEAPLEVIFVGSVTE